MKLPCHRLVFPPRHHTETFAGGFDLYLKPPEAVVEGHEEEVEGFSGAGESQQMQPFAFDL